MARVAVTLSRASRPIGGGTSFIWDTPRHNGGPQASGQARRPRVSDGPPRSVGGERGEHQVRLVGEHAIDPGVDDEPELGEPIAEVAS